MAFRRFVCILGLTLFPVIGCATASDRAAESLVRQQSATIESLKGEILRLNQELDGTSGSREDFRLAMPVLEKKLEVSIARGDVQVILDSRGLVVRVLDHALFDPDESQFTAAGEAILKGISTVLSAELVSNRVNLEGHTDNRPIEGADGITNWEYSIGRASAVLHYFVDAQGLAPQRFGVVGFSEYHPLTVNTTEEGRDRNRRVEIVILSQKVSSNSEEGRGVL
jgi:flagellar motor protein MotB